MYQTVIDLFQQLSTLSLKQNACITQQGNVSSCLVQECCAHVMGNDAFELFLCLGVDLILSKFYLFLTLTHHGKKGVMQVVIGFLKIIPKPALCFFVGIHKTERTKNG